jgi:DNA polymerase-1
VANKPIQRTAAEMMNLELIDLDTRLKQEVPAAKIIIQLHDAVDVYCREKDQPRVANIMMDVMDREWKVDGRVRRFPVEMKTAFSSQNGTWADV